MTTADYDGELHARERSARVLSAITITGARFDSRLCLKLDPTLPADSRRQKM